MSDNPFEQPGTPPVSLEQRAEQLLENISGGGDWWVDKQSALHNADVIRTRSGVLVAATRTYATKKIPADFQNPSDAEFIAAAPQLVRDLLSALQAAEHRQEAEVEKLRQENENLKFDVQELKESFGDMTEIASTAESSLAAVKQENAQFRAAMASCSGCDSPDGANPLHSRAESVSPTQPEPDLLAHVRTLRDAVRALDHTYAEAADLLDPILQVADALDVLARPIHVTRNGEPHA